MGRTVAIGIQDFQTIVKGNYFYIDKTEKSGDTLAYYNNFLNAITQKEVKNRKLRLDRIGRNRI